ncbi:MAG: GNAT family N-acetyltransferase [Phycisphaeraceae bacterium]|nr:GNAT family N-acetyltransferase [Phycisphaeraceae bacterium]
MTEDDWPLLLPWNQDPQLLFLTEGTGNPKSYTLAQIQNIYRTVSQHAYNFMIEHQNQPIGECWLQEMNLAHVTARYPGKDCRRIDLMIGAKTFWGQGIGSTVIDMLCEFGFGAEKADLIFGLVGSHNPRSRRTFEKNGFILDIQTPQPPGSKAEHEYTLILTPQVWRSRSPAI